MSGLGGIEREAKAEFEREILGQIIAHGDADGRAPATEVEQAIGYYRYTEAGNLVQQVLGRRLRAAVAALQSTRVLAISPPPDYYVVTPYGRALYALRREAWWRRTLARF